MSDSESYLKEESKNLFNLIRDFPNSENEINLIKLKLNSTNSQKFISQTISDQIEDRLLIPGAHTEDILKMFLKINKILQILFENENNRNFYFKLINNNLINHLIKRPDSIKCIISELLSNDVSDDDIGADRLPDCEEDPDGLDWVPPPLDRGEGNKMKTLIEIYGSREVFLNEYFNLLSSRLLKNSNFEIEREVSSFELIKNKFSNSQNSEILSNCQIMLKDILYSKSMNNRIPNKHNISIFILSKHFWPKYNNLELSTETETVEEIFPFLPNEILNQLNNFKNNFNKIKKFQKLRFLKNEGIITINLNLKNGKEFDLKISPIQLAVLSLFQKIHSMYTPLTTPVPSACVPPPSLGPILSLEEVGNRVGESVESARQIVNFWISKGILKEIEINKFTIND